MPAWALKVASIVVSTLVLAASWGYAATHVKNPNAPLQPPVPGGAAIAAPPAPTATPTPVPPLLQNRPGVRRPPSSPGAVFSIAPGVQATALPKITITHVS